MRSVFVSAAIAAVFSSVTVAAEVESVMLMYQAQEPGVSPYASRILVTERYVRMDDGVDDGDYLVFDRKKRLISSVTHEEQTVFEIPAREVTQESPLALELHTEHVQDDEPQTFAGKEAEYRQLFVNGELCYSVVAVPGLMGDAVRAMREFRVILAGEHAKMLPRLPADMQEACDLALNTFEPEWQLQFGLPLQEWDEKGNQQVLMNYDEALLVDEALFALPQGYKHYNTDSI